MPGPLLPSTFSRSLMCCRLQPVSSRLRSDSCWDESSLVWTFLRSFGLPETQQEAVFPISALLSASGPEEGGSWNQPLEPTAHPTPPRRSRRSQRCPERMTRVRVAASSRVAPAFCVHGEAAGTSPGMDRVTSTGGPVVVCRSLLDPLRQTWRSGTHPAPCTDEMDPGSSWIGVRAIDRRGGGQIPETVPVHASV